MKIIMRMERRFRLTRVNIHKQETDENDIYVVYLFDFVLQIKPNGYVERIWGIRLCEINGVIVASREISQTRNSSVNIP